MAAAFLAMNEVFGQFFDVNLVEMFEPAAYAQSGTPRDLFVFDDQLHMVRGTQPAAARRLRALAQGPSSAPTFKSNPYNPKSLPDERGDVWGVWNPALVGLPITRGERPDRAIHQRRFSGQPGDDRSAEQCHRVIGNDWSAKPRRAAEECCRKR